MSKGFKNIVISLLVINLVFIYYLYYSIPQPDQLSQYQLSQLIQIQNQNNETEQLPLSIEQKNKPFIDLKRSIYVVKPWGVDHVSYGTGMLIDENIMITAWHVLKDRYEDVPKEKWSDTVFQIQKNIYNESTPYDATLISHNEKYDIAIIKVNGIQCPCVPLYDGKISYEEIIYSAYQLHVMPTEIITQGKLINRSVSSMYSTNPSYYGASGGGVLIKRKEGFYLVGLIRAMPVIPINDNNTWPLNYVTISTPSVQIIPLLEDYQKTLDKPN